LRWFYKRLVILFIIVSLVLMLELWLTFDWLFSSPSIFISLFFTQTLILSFESILSSFLVFIILIINCFDLFYFESFFSIASLIFDTIQFFRIWPSLFWFYFILFSMLFLVNFFPIWSLGSILSLNLVLILLIANYFCFFLNHFFFNCIPYISFKLFIFNLIFIVLVSFLFYPQFFFWFFSILSPNI
jgi:hypothetical protein